MVKSVDDFDVVVIRNKDVGPELQCLLRVKEDLS